VPWRGGRAPPPKLKKDREKGVRETILGIEEKVRRGKKEVSRARLRRRFKGKWLYDFRREKGGRTGENKSRRKKAGGKGLVFYGV